MYKKTKMKTLKLNTSERIGIISILNELYQAGGLTLQALTNASKVTNKCTLDEKDKKSAKFTENKNESGVVTGFTWDNKYEKDIEFADDEINLIKDSIKTKNDKKGFNLQDKFIIPLMEKIDLDLSK
jgi:hypothetical protein